MLKILQFKQKYCLFLLLLLISCNNNKLDEHPINSLDFEQEEMGQLSYAQIKNLWPNANLLCGKKDFICYRLGFSINPMIISTENNNKFLKILIPNKKFGPITGAQWKFPTTKCDELFLKYRLKFEDNFDFAKGGKLPGLAGGTANSGGIIPTGYDGWSARMMFWDNGKISFYVYCANQSGKWGERLYLKDSVGDTLKLTRGNWYTITQHIVMNTPGLKNGIIQGWVNGKEVFYTDTIVFRKTDELKIDQILFSVFMGGDDKSWAPKRNQYLCFDDIQIYQTPQELNHAIQLH